MWTLSSCLVSIYIPCKVTDLSCKPAKLLSLHIAMHLTYLSKRVISWLSALRLSSLSVLRGP